MNKTLFVLFVSTIFLSSCAKKDTTTPNNNSLILGSWLSTSEHDRVYTINTNALVKDTTYTSFPKKYAWSEIYNKNGTFYYVDYYEPPIPDTIFSAHYSIYNQGIKVIYDSNGAEVQYSILKISDTDLVLEEVDLTHPLPGENHGLDQGSIYKYVFDVYYKKQ